MTHLWLAGQLRSAGRTHQRVQAQVTEKPLVANDNGIFLTFVIKKKNVTTRQQKINAGLLSYLHSQLQGDCSPVSTFAF